MPLDKITLLSVFPNIRYVFSLFLLGVIAFSACEDPPFAADGYACSKLEDCLQNYACINGKCVNTKASETKVIEQNNEATNKKEEPASLREKEATSFEKKPTKEKSPEKVEQTAEKTNIEADGGVHETK